MFDLRLSHKQALYTYHFIQILIPFTPLIISSDMIILLFFFGRQFFTHRVPSPDQPSNSHVTLRCDVSSILHAAKFLSKLCSPLTDGATVVIWKYEELKW